MIRKTQTGRHLAVSNFDSVILVTYSKSLLKPLNDLNRILGAAYRLHEWKFKLITHVSIHLRSISFANIGVREALECVSKVFARFLGAEVLTIAK